MSVFCFRGSRSKKTASHPAGKRQRRGWIPPLRRNVALGLLGALLPLVSCPLIGAWAQEQPQPTKPAKSLDRQLLDDLDAGLPEAVAVPKSKAQTPAETAEPARAKPDAAKADLDERLKRDLGEGEDIEFGKPQDPLTKIGERMRAAEELIGKRNTSIKTQTLQREILGDLDALIARLEKQCQCAGGEPKPSQSRSNAGKPKPSGAESADTGQESEKPAEDSTERVGKNEQAEVEGQEFHELMRAVWGNLPPRVRQQMQNASIEQFLPKYEKLIEEYYKRLAEEPR